MARITELLSLSESAPREAREMVLPSATLEGWRWSGLRRALPATPFAAADGSTGTVTAPKLSNASASMTETVLIDGHLAGDNNGGDVDGRRHINSDSDGDGNGRRHIKGDNNGAAGRRHINTGGDNNGGKVNGRRHINGDSDGDSNGGRVNSPINKDNDSGSCHINVMRDADLSEPPARNGEETPFPALARTLATHPLQITVKGENKTPHSIRLVGTAANTAAHLSLNTELEKNASLHCVITSEAANNEARLVNSDCRFHLREGARLRLLILENEAAQCFRTSRIHFTLAANARAETFLITRGGAFQRLEIETDLADNGAEFHIGGAHALSPSRQAEVALRVRHLAGDTLSRNRFRAAVGANATHNFQGRIEIIPGADNAAAEMESKSLLMDESAKSRSKPELEIFHDNVACSHGVAVSPADADVLFYLRSRGIPLADAERLTVSAFLRQIFPAEHNDEFTESAKSRVETFAGMVTETVKGQAS
ncbi:MAG: SufD family Fe-S cluster assembly protein [Alphaproteobacteria bacterium]|nr:SufD family Fe-S cluster assembly protein [Alphaproteobacteria bacterium]